MYLSGLHYLTIYCNTGAIRVATFLKHHMEPSFQGDVARWLHHLTSCCGDMRYSNFYLYIAFVTSVWCQLYMLMDVLLCVVLQLLILWVQVCCCYCELRSAAAATTGRATATRSVACGLLPNNFNCSMICTIFIAQ